MKRRAIPVYCLAIIASVSISSGIWARPKGDVWERKRTPVPSKRVEFDTSTVNGKIYVIGGTVWDDGPRRGRVLRTVEEYDHVTNQWQRRASMRIGRTDLSTSVVNGKIYAIGGNIQLWMWRKHVEVYDPVTNTWDMRADMLEVRPTFSATAADGRIYVMGGADDESTEAYDPFADRWEKRAKMPSTRSHFATTAVDGMIYAMGGPDWGQPGEHSRSVEAYDPATDTWEKRADMPTARCCLSAETVDGIIYAIGGEFGGQVLRTVEAYNPTTDTWETMADMPEGRMHFSTSVIDGKIYVFSGAWDFTRTLLIYTPPFRPPRSVDSAGKAATTWGRVKTGR